jgi:hypothetical protein
LPVEECCLATKLKNPMRADFAKTVCPILFIVVCAFWAGLARAQQTNGQPLYQSSFDKAALDSLPEDILVMDGNFKIKEAEGRKVLELPGAPAENFYGALFGPVTNSGVCVSARIFGSGARRRFPSFGLGLNGDGGYCLRVSPAKGMLELYKGNEIRTNALLAWKPASWTLLRLQVRPANGSSWIVEGKAWEQGTPEPKDWMIAVEEKTAPPKGKASLWGTPYSGAPIWFADLKVNAIGPGE